jgi:hypothetical protein
MKVEKKFSLFIFQEHVIKFLSRGYEDQATSNFFEVKHHNFPLLYTYFIHFTHKF